MKKIAFVVEGMYLGGVETTLINLLKKIIKEDKYNVTLLLINNEGDLISNIPKGVNVIKIPDASELLNTSKNIQILKYIKEFKLITATSYFFNKLIYKILRNREVYYSWYTKKLGLYDEKFDVAVSYNMPDSFCVKYVSDCINSDKKIMWNHVDISLYNNNELKGLEKTFKKFDRIYSVSEYSNNVFKKNYPMIKDKCSIFYNIVNREEIILKSNENLESQMNFNGIKLLTVGRITSQKGQDYIVDIARRLKEDKYNFKWYLLGPIADRNFYIELMKNIEKNDLKEYIEYLGTNKNPYYFMSKCDIYVQPSRYEGFCTTTNEAKVLCKPVITTNCSGAKEQFENGVTGIIVQLDIDEMYESTKKLIECKELRNLLSNNLKLYENRNERGVIDEIFQIK